LKWEETNSKIHELEDRVFRVYTYLKAYFFAFIDEMQIEMALKTNFLLY